MDTDRVLWLCGVWLLVDPAVAATSSVGLSSEPVTVPPWLVVSTGGGVIGASFLITALVTDHETIQSVTNRQWSVPTWLVNRYVSSAIRLLGITVLGGVVVSGIVVSEMGMSEVVWGRSETANFAILFVWIGWWVVYTISVYLLGNTWPMLNPWRTLALVVAPRLSIERSVPGWLCGWPSVVCLLGLVWVAVVSPVTTSPQLLVVVIVAYSLFTITGGVVYGAPWFRRVDPIARLFRAYGRVAPFQRVSSRIALTVPGRALTDGATDRSEAMFIVAVLWVTTYDGLLTTPAWSGVARAVVGVGIPPLAVYAVGMGGGFGVFLLVYRAGARYARRTGRTYVAARVIEKRFVRSLLPIAASYHFAHYLGTVLGLSAALWGTFLQPFVGQLQLLSILCGHLLAVWVAHTTAFDLFTGRFQSIRSQYPFILMMIAYTMIGMWIVLQPSVQPPFVP